VSNEQPTCHKCGRINGGLEDIRNHGIGWMDGKCFARYAYRDPDAQADCDRAKLASIPAQSDIPPPTSEEIEFPKPQSTTTIGKIVGSTTPEPFNIEDDVLPASAELLGEPGWYLCNELRDDGTTCQRPRYWTGIHFYDDDGLCMSSAGLSDFQLLVPASELTAKDQKIQDLRQYFATAEKLNADLREALTALQSSLSGVQGALADAGTVLANREDGDYEVCRMTTPHAECDPSKSGDNAVMVAVAYTTAEATLAKVREILGPQLSYDDGEVRCGITLAKGEARELRELLGRGE
jgi:hypothetical protein